MKVEVILCEVRKRHNIEQNAVNTTETQRMRRHLDSNDLDVIITHPGEKTMQVRRLGSRTYALDRFARAHSTDRPDQCCDLSIGTKHAVEHVGDGRFAVRTGDADHHHVASRRPMDCCGYRSEEAARVRHNDLGHLYRNTFLNEDRGRPGHHRALDESVPVGSFAADRHEQAAGFNLTRVVGHVREHGIGVATDDLGRLDEPCEVGDRYARIHPGGTPSPCIAAFTMAANTGAAETPP
ncbi:hypothetical protein BMS3Bbin02_00782 [bacterium BMS3Bbin02]|nr:hypothetical protein BMS3Bbin02_00782 [bacterium BMS3Bbin02]